MRLFSGGYTSSPYFKFRANFRFFSAYASSETEAQRDTLSIPGLCNREDRPKYLHKGFQYGLLVCLLPSNRAVIALTVKSVAVVFKNVIQKSLTSLQDVVIGDIKVSGVPGICDITRALCKV